jgi:hypothetical protein
MPPTLVLDELTEAELANIDFVNAHLVVTRLTAAWHYVLRVPDHDEVAERIERAIECGVVMRQKLRRRGKR